MENKDTRFIANPYQNTWHSVDVPELQVAHIFMKRLEDFSNSIPVPCVQSRCSDPAKNRQAIDMFQGAGGYLYLYVRLYKFFSSIKPGTLDMFRASCNTKDETFKKITDPEYYLWASKTQSLELTKLISKYDKRYISFCFSAYPIYVYGAYLAFLSKDVMAFEMNIKKLMQGYQIICNDHQNMEYEILYGIPGYMIMLLQIQSTYRVAGLENEAYHVDVTKQVQKLVWFVINQGLSNYSQKYGQKVNLDKQLPENFRLIYLFHKTQYLGGAHGLAGVLNVLLLAYQLNSMAGFSKKVNNAIRLTCAKSVQFLLTQRINDNFRTSISNRPPSSKLSQFCHGNPGIVTPLLHFCQLFPQSANALNLKEIVVTHLNKIFQQGVLKKGYWGLCHGVSGNIYPFISPVLHKVLPMETAEFKKKAAILWILQQNPNIQAEISGFEFKDRIVKGVSDYPCSLMLGTAGDLCLATDLLQGEGVFPGFDI